MHGTGATHSESGRKTSILSRLSREGAGGRARWDRTDIKVCYIVRFPFIETLSTYAKYFRWTEHFRYLWDGRKGARRDIHAGSVYNKSGDDVYKQQMMDNFRFPIVGVDRVVAKPNPTIRGPRPRDGLRIRMPSFYRKRFIH